MASLPRDGVPARRGGRFLIAALVLLAIGAAVTIRSRVPTALTCPPGHARVEAHPPSGLVAWCERATFTTGTSGTTATTGATEAAASPATAEGRARRDGPFAAWYPDGRPKAVGSYRDGQPHGTFTFWDGNGRKREEGGFQDGREEGPWRRFHGSGAPREAGAYHAGVRTGPWTFWFSNGQKSAEGEYRDGAPVGVWAHWNPRGDPCPAAEAGPAGGPPGAAGA